MICLSECNHRYHVLELPLQRNKGTLTSSAELQKRYETWLPTNYTRSTQWKNPWVNSRGETERHRMDNNLKNILTSWTRLCHWRQNWTKIMAPIHSWRCVTHWAKKKSEIWLTPKFLQRKEFLTVNFKILIIDTIILHFLSNKKFLSLFQVIVLCSFYFGVSGNKPWVTFFHIEKQYVMLEIK